MSDIGVLRARSKVTPETLMEETERWRDVCFMKREFVKKHIKTIHIAIVILIMGFIFAQSALPGDLSGKESNAVVQLLAQILSIDPESPSFVVRKAAHFTEYLILGDALVPVMREHGRGCFLAWCIGTAYAVTDEIHQSIVPGRSCELRDMCIDSSGVLTGVLIGLLIILLSDHKTLHKEKSRIQ